MEIDFMNGKISDEINEMLSNVSTVIAADGKIICCY